MRRLAVAAVIGIAAAFCVPPVAAQISPERLREAAMQIARLLGLSDAGTRVWAEASIERSDGRSFRGLEDIQAQIGGELSAAAPDRRRLRILTEAYAAESAKVALAEKEHLIDTAFKLDAADRRALGAFIERSSREELDRGGRVLEVLPVARP